MPADSTHTLHNSLTIQNNRAISAKGWPGGLLQVPPQVQVDLAGSFLRGQGGARGACSPWLRFWSLSCITDERMVMTRVIGA